MKINKEHQFPGIYCIINTNTLKKYIGKSKNIYKRLHQHVYDLKNNRKEENPYLQKAWNKYGSDNFEYIILDKFTEITEDLLSEKELYYINLFRVTDSKYGYNLRKDSNTKMICHELTSLKISNRLKKEWKSGIRNNHSQKLKQNWKNNTTRKIKQSQLFSKTKTKYMYYIQTPNGDNIKVLYQELCELGLQNCIATFCKKKTDNIIFKSHVIKRVIIEDIVQSSK